MIFALCAVAWFAFGVLASGFNYAYFQGKYPTLAERDRVQDTRDSAFFVFLGVCAFFGMWTACGNEMFRYGWWIWGRKN